MSVFDLHAGDAKSRTSSEDLQARLQGPVLQYEAHEGEQSSHDGLIDAW